MSGEFQHKLFGCFDNFKVCLWTTFVPCYVAGKIAEKVGESCFTYGCLMFVPVANLVCRSKIRGKVREQKGIAGDNCNDLLMSFFCGGCAMCQEAKEVGALDAPQAMAQEMTRD